MKGKLAFLVSLAVLAASITMQPPVTARADTTVTVDVSSTDSDWEISITGATYNEDIPGHGEIINQKSAYLTKYTGSNSRVTIPRKIEYTSVNGRKTNTTIDNMVGSGVFANTSVEELSCTLADWTFGSGAFTDSSVSSVDSAGRTMIFEAGAFNGSNASSLNLSGVVHLESGSLSGYDSLEELTLSGVVTLDSGCFSGCPNLSRIIFDYNTIVNSSALKDETLGCPSNTAIQVYGDKGLWQDRSKIAYQLERLDPYISYNTGAASLYVGDSIDLGIELHNDSLVSMSCVSSNAKAARVSNEGVVTALKAGTSSIKVIVTTPDNVYTENINIKVSSILNKTSLILKKGKIYTLKPNISSIKTTYSSSNKSVCTVSKAGVIKAKKAGTAVVKVKSVNGGTHKLKVRVTK